MSVSIIDLTDLAKLTTRIQRVRDLHQPVRNNGAHFQVCAHDNHTYPCPTIQALEGDQK